MISATVMDQSRLAAFVDGELSPEEAAEIVLHLADHPQDQAYVDALMTANEALSQAFSDPLDEPVPNAIRETVSGKSKTANVLPFRKRSVVWLGTGLAAVLALAVTIGPELAGPNDALRLAVGPVENGSALATSLDHLPSGVPETRNSEQSLMVLATLPVNDGYCREFEIISYEDERVDLGIACFQSDGWVVEVTMSEPLSATGTEDGFVTASGTEMQGLMPFLDRLGAGDALAPAQEASLIERGWKD